MKNLEQTKTYLPENLQAVNPEIVNAINWFKLATEKAVNDEVYSPKEIVPFEVKLANLLWVWKNKVKKLLERTSMKSANDENYSMQLVA